MGLLDFFGRKSGAGAIKKHAKRAADKRAQNADRWQSLHALAQMETAEAAEALLQRFTFRVDPSITDQEEKDLAMTGVINAGDEAIEPVREFLRESKSIAWPVKMLDQLVSLEDLVSTLLEVLEGMHTDYMQNPQRKIDLLAQLEDRVDPRIAPAVQRFLQDDNESARFHAAATTFAQENASESREALLDVVADEESVRVKVRILDGFIERDWGLGERTAELLEASALPSGYVVDGERLTRKR